METGLCNPDQLSWLVPISQYQGDSPNNPLTTLLQLLTTLLHLLTTLLHHPLIPIPQLAGTL